MRLKREETEGKRGGRKGGRERLLLFSQMVPLVCFSL